MNPRNSAMDPEGKLALPANAVGAAARELHGRRNRMPSAGGLPSVRLGPRLGMGLGFLILAALETVLSACPLTDLGVFPRVQNLPQALPPPVSADAVAHHPPATPASTGGRLHLFRNDSSQTLVVRWEGFFDDGAGGMGDDPEDPSGVLFWNRYYLGPASQFPGGVDPREARVAPGEYLVGISGALQGRKASGWSVLPGACRAQQADESVLHFRVQRGRGVVRLAQAIEVRAGSSALGSRRVLDRIRDTPGILGLQVTLLTASRAFPRGGWLYSIEIDTERVGLAPAEVARDELLGPAGVDIRASIIVSATARDTAPPLQDGVWMGAHPPVNPGDVAEWTPLDPEAILKELQPELRRMPRGEILAIWRQLATAAILRAIPARAIVTRSGRPAGSARLESGQASLLPSAGGTLRVQVHGDMDDLALSLAPPPAGGADGIAWRSGGPDARSEVLVRRTLRLAVEAPETIYDGAPRTPHLRLEGRLRAGDRAEIHPNVVGPEAGAYPADARVRVVAGDGSIRIEGGAGSSGAAYRIDSHVPTYRIHKRPLRLHQPGMTAVYGDAVAPEVFRAEGLAAGHRVEDLGLSGLPGRESPAGTYDLLRQVRIRDASGVDRTGSHDLSGQSVRLRVQPRPVRVGFQRPIEREYNGLPVQLTPVLLEGSLPSFDQLQARDYSSPADAGVHRAVPEVRLRHRATGDDRTSSYLISTEATEVRILPASVRAEIPAKVWQGARRIQAEDLALAWDAPRAGGRRPAGRTRWVASSPAGTLPLEPGMELLPDVYRIEAEFTPDGPNFRTGRASADWTVRLPVRFQTAGARLIPRASQPQAVSDLWVTPGEPFSIEATPAEDHAWGNTWDDSLPEIWASDVAGLLSESDRRRPLLNVTWPRRVRALSLSARAYQLPPRLEPIQFSGTALVNPGAGEHRILIGRGPLEVLLEGVCRESPVGRFEVEWQAPGMSQWKAAGVGLPKEPSRARQAVRVGVETILGERLPDRPLIPAGYATWPHARWRVRARVASVTGRWSDWREVEVEGVLPRSLVRLPLRTHPPAGEAAEWFEPSAERWVDLHVWQP